MKKELKTRKFADGVEILDKNVRRYEAKNDP
jgi:hypothetical protein